MGRKTRSAAPPGSTLRPTARALSVLRSPAVGTPALAARAPRPARAPRAPPVPLGMRWPVERTNSWLTNFGQLRRNTDRRIIHRLAQLALAIALLITAKLIDWCNRWSPNPPPIR